MPPGLCVSWMQVGQRSPKATACPCWKHEDGATACLPRVMRHRFREVLAQAADQRRGGCST